MSSPPLTSSSQFFPSFQMRRWMKFNWTLSCWHHARQVVIICHAVFSFPSSSSRQTSADWPFHFALLEICALPRALTLPRDDPIGASAGSLSKHIIKAIIGTSIYWLLTYYTTLMWSACSLLYLPFHSHFGQSSLGHFSAVRRGGWRLTTIEHIGASDAIRYHPVLSKSSPSKKIKGPLLCKRHTKKFWQRSKAQ